MDIHEKLMIAFCIYVNRPKNYMILHCSENHLISGILISHYYPVMDIYYCLKIMVFQDVTLFSSVDMYLLPAPYGICKICWCQTTQHHFIRPQSL